MVLIEGVVKSGWKGAIQMQMIPLKYCPRVSAYATISYETSGLDMNKIIAASVNSSGNLFVWVIESLAYVERFSVVYPLKSD